MVSLIDFSKPVYGTPTTQSVRDNFQIAQNEITDLQQLISTGPFLPLSGGIMTGKLELWRHPVSNLEAATKQYVDDLAFTGGGMPDAPKNGFYYVRGGGDTTQATENEWIIDPIFNSLRLWDANKVVMFGMLYDATYNYYDLMDASGCHFRFNRSTKLLELAINSTINAGFSDTVITFNRHTLLAHGLSFSATNVATDPTDLTQHLDLFGGAYGLSISNGHLNIVAGNTRFISGANNIATFNTDGLSMWFGQITLAIDPTFAMSAATKQYVDSVRSLVTGSYLPLTGGTLSGQVLLYGNIADPILNLQNPSDVHVRMRYGNTLRQWSTGIRQGDGCFTIGDETIGDYRFVIDQNGNVTIQGVLNLPFDPTSALHAATKQYVDTKAGQYLPITGGTLTGRLATTDRPITINWQSSTPSYFAYGFWDTTTSSGYGFFAYTPTVMAIASINVTGDATNPGIQFDAALNNISFPGGGGIKLGTINSDPALVTGGIQMYPGFGGFGVTGGTLNYNWTGVHTFFSNNVLMMEINSNGLLMHNNLALVSDPTSALHAATKQYVDGKVGGAGYLPLTGGTINGNLDIYAGSFSVMYGVVFGFNGAGYSALYMNSAPDTNRITYYQSNGSTRWIYGTSAGPESGGDVGSDFFLSAYTDAGGGGKTAFLFSRATGLGIVAGDPTTALGIATKQYVDGKIPVGGGISDAPVNGDWYYARHNGTWVTTSAFTRIDTGTTFDLDSIGGNGGTFPYNWHVGMVSTTNQTTPINYPPGLNTGFIIYGYDSNPAWQNQIFMCGSGGLPNIFFRSYNGSGMGSWDRIITQKGGTLTGTLQVSRDPTAALEVATKQYVDGKVGAYLPLTGGTLTGPLTATGPITSTGGALAAASTTGYATLNLSKGASGQGNQIVGYTNNSLRWVMAPGESAPETGANAGSDFGIFSYDDAGQYISRPFFIQRSTGAISLAGYLSVNNSAIITGNVQINGILNGYGNLMAINDGGNAFVGSHHGGNSAVGMWNMSNTLYIGNADGNGTVSTVRAMFDNAGGFGVNRSDVSIYQMIGGTFLTISGQTVFNNSANLIINGGGRPDYAIEFYWGAARQAMISQDNHFWLVSGTGFKPGGGAWADTSDIRIKNVTGDYTLGLNEILNLNPIRFTFKGNDKSVADQQLYHPDTVKEYVGLAAQDVEHHFPEMVTLREGLIDDIRVDDMRVLDLSSLPLALVNAVKELYARIVTLETQLATRS